MFRSVTFTASQRKIFENILFSLLEYQDASSASYMEDMQGVSAPEPRQRTLSGTSRENRRKTAG
jgi:hypothetical protein